jgi:hypothetical protein
MSRYWDVHCIDCDSDLGLDDTGLVEAKDTLKAAEVIAVFAESVDRLDLEYVDFEVRSDFRSRPDSGWLRKHRGPGHRLIVRDEYGYFLGECGKTRSPAHKNGTWSCRHLEGHKGECSTSPLIRIARYGLHRGPA